MQRALKTSFKGGECIFRIIGVCSGPTVVCWTASERSEVQTPAMADIWIEISALCTPLGVEHSG